MVASHRWEKRNMPAKHLTSVYGNGWQAVLSVYGNGCAIMSYSLYNSVLRFMEMVSKQFSPFMEMVVQPCLTACATASYRVCNCVLRFMEMVDKQFSPFMETVLEVVRAKISGYTKS
jgi:hypothetical protein